MVYVGVCDGPFDEEDFEFDDDEGLTEEPVDEEEEESAARVSGERARRETSEVSVKCMVGSDV